MCEEMEKMPKRRREQLGDKDGEKGVRADKKKRKEIGGRRTRRVRG